MNPRSVAPPRSDGVGCRCSSRLDKARDLSVSGFLVRLPLPPCRRALPVLWKGTHPTQRAKRTHVMLLGCESQSSAWPREPHDPYRALPDD
jgi:hypothetical protein